MDFLLNEAARGLAVARREVLAVCKSIWAAPGTAVKQEGNQRHHSLLPPRFNSFTEYFYHFC